MIDHKKLQQLKDQYGDIYELSAMDASVYVKAPSRPSVKRFFATISDDKRRFEALEQLLRDCVVDPSQDELDKLLDRKPGLVATFGGKLMELAGAQEEATFRTL